jgi:hypothetical protein
MSQATAVCERPIIFSGPMVKAILDGRKTQTRRVAKPPAKAVFLPNDYWRIDLDEPGTAYLDDESGRLRIACPYGQPGDRLWVRETWWSDRREPGVAVYDATPEWGKYRDATEPIRSTHLDDTLTTREEARAAMLPKFWSKRPSIFMPRWASRLTLIVKAVKIERLHEISTADCLAEGIRHAEPPSPVNFYTDGASTVSSTPHGAFGGLWCHLHGAESWNDNPEVVAISFSVHECNIDAMPVAEAA